MPLFPAADRAFAEAVTTIDYMNPFLPERVATERRLLGESYIEVGGVKAMRPDSEGADPNSTLLLERVEVVLGRAIKELDAVGTPADEELHLFEGLALFVLYNRWKDELAALLVQPAPDAAKRLRVTWYERFREEALAALRPGDRRLSVDLDPPHLLAFFFQIRRAFHHIYSNILGTSDAAVRLRAAIWQSIFTHDIRRYQRSMYRHMVDLSTLVTGPSGTGKELVACAVGSSGYIPFDEQNQAFSFDPAELFLPLNISALSPTLIESELFGHRRGAFTGALEDRAGWFEVCHPHGAVFLDEIGEIEPEIQVKLLRVLQTRRFHRLGDTRPRQFRGKLISATNLDLAEEMARGRFREDLYYRICSDRIVTPSLAEQVQGSMEELHHLALFVGQRLIGDEAPALAAEVVEWVETNLGRDYAWPGNFRELEQCARNVLIRKEYRPHHAITSGSADELAREFRRAELTAEEMLRRYCTLVYERTGSYEGAARALGLDRRTVKSRIDEGLLARLRRGTTTGEGES